MGKKKKGKNRKKYPPPSANNPAVSNMSFNHEPPKKKKWWQKGWAIVMGIFLILGGLAGLKPVRELFMSKHAVYEQENFDTGTLKSLKIGDVSLDYDTLELQDRPIFNKARRDTLPLVKGIKIKDTSPGENIKVLVGSGVWFLSKDILKKGIKIFDADTTSECSETKLNLILHDGRIYASAEFRDFKNEEIVGTMNYNYWKVYLKNLLTYRYDDYKLEVLDKQGYVIFSIAFHDNDVSPTGVVSVSGYFMNPQSVLIVNTGTRPSFFTSETQQQMLDLRKCITKDSGGTWRREAEKLISKIKTVFNQPEPISF